MPPLLSCSLVVTLILGMAALWSALRTGAPSAIDTMFNGPAIVGVLLAVSVADVLIFQLARPRRAPGAWLTVTVFTLALAISATEIRQAYPRGSAHDFPHAFTSFHEKNFNLTESLIAAQNILRGRGNALSVAGGTTKMDTYRMPGYAMFVALAGTLFRVSPEDLVGLGAAAVYQQVWFFCLALTYAVWRLSRALPIAVVALLGVTTCWLPQELDLTQNDSTILACGLLIAGALSPFFDRDTDPASEPFRRHLAVHAAFGLYLLMRSDVLVGWAGVSLFLYRRRPVYLLLPFCVFLAIGGPWGLYKRAHGSSFVMTTSNIGHVAFVGLWQTPRHKFVWEPSDESYVNWINRYGYVYMEPRANAFAIREVLRFWFTYPGFVIGNVWYKAYSYFRYEVWTGSLSLAPARVAGGAMRVGGCWLLFLTLLLESIVRYERRVTFLLGWPVLLDLPLFWVLQHNARYVAFVNWSLMAAIAPALLAPDFYRRLAARKRTAAAVVAAGITVWVAAPVITTLLTSDPVRYWTPWLDPSRSTLNIRAR